MSWETKKLLVTVKAYPHPSKKYVETVCVAGITIDKKEWVRLYPIPFRDLEEDKKFKKYSIIKVKAKKPSDDKRPESYKVDAGSIRILDYLNTEKKWLKRKEIVLPTVSKSMCEILEKSKTEDKSLGVFRPTRVDFSCSKSPKEDVEEIKKCYAQISFVDKDKKPIEIIPYTFRYSFYCANEPSCTGHTLPIIDWEIGQAYRSWRWQYKPEQVLLQKIKERWLDKMCVLKNEVYFFVGNMKRFRDKFMVLGTFYPPR